MSGGVFNCVNGDRSNPDFMSCKEVHVQKVVLMKAFNRCGVRAYVKLATSPYQKRRKNFCLEDCIVGMNMDRGESQRMEWILV